MNYLSVENISKSYGVNTLFEGVTFGINKGQKVAFVAKNGTGKSSLLKILIGKNTPDTGQIIFRKDLQVKFLEQEPNFGSNLTVDEVIYNADIPILRVIKDYEKCMKNPSNTEAIQRAFEKIEEVNAWELEIKIKKILSTLKLNELNTNEVKHLSGGQKKRIALAKVLIENPDFLILDEPTNHLDLDMIEWLEEYLSREKITLFMVTHDRYFLECVCDEIIELSDKKIYKYKGNYSHFLQKKSEREENETVNISKAINLMKKELEWIRRQPKARSTKSKARIDSFGELKERTNKRIDNKVVELEINFPRLGNKILEFHNVKKSFGKLKVIDKLNYNFKRGERIGIVGNNGTGKSTLLKLIMQQERVDAGKIVVGETVKFGYYSQEGLSFNHDDKVIDIVKKIAEYIPLNKGKKISASQLLERFLFSKEKQYQFVSKLSGGERKRLYLCTVLMNNPNFLILDEPTNDLDIVTLNVLENFLLDFGGCIIAVTHDRYFMDKLVDSIFVFQGNGIITNFIGNYTEYKAIESSKKQREKVFQVKKQDTQNKTNYKESKEFRALEKDIEKLEKRKEKINHIFSNNDILLKELQELSSELEHLNTILEEKMLKWLKMSES